MIPITFPFLSDGTFAHKQSILCLNIMHLIDVNSKDWEHCWFLSDNHLLLEHKFFLNLSSTVNGRFCCIYMETMEFIVCIIYLSFVKVFWIEKLRTCHLLWGSQGVVHTMASYRDILFKSTKLDSYLCLLVYNSPKRCFV